MTELPDKHKKAWDNAEAIVARFDQVLAQLGTGLVVSEVRMKELGASSSGRGYVIVPIDEDSYYIIFEK